MPPLAAKERLRPSFTTSVAVTSALRSYRVLVELSKMRRRTVIESFWCLSILSGMFHRGPIRWVLIRCLGADEGQPPHYYRDLLLGLPFILGALMAFVLALELRFSKTFWICSSIAAVCLLFARERWALIGGLFAFVAIRCVVGIVLYREPIAALGFLVSSLLIWLIVKRAERQSVSSNRWRN